MNVLGIGAHFDDLELGCSGALIRHAQAGDKVVMLVISDSAYSSPKGQIIRTREQAREEGLKAARIIGAEVLCLETPTFFVPFNEDLTQKITAIIEKYKIDTVYSHWINDLHRDHQYAGRCALMAARHVPRFLMYRSNYYETEQPFRGNFYADISAVFNLKLKAIKAHVSELERVKHQWISFIRHQNRNDGMRIGVQFAETFEVVRYLI